MGRTSALLLSIFGLIGVFGYREARSDPIQRRATIALADWPVGAAPTRIALIGDIHFGNAATDRPRLNTAIADIAAQKPDLVLLAGDYVAGDDPTAAVGFSATVADSLRGLHPPLGIVAVLGNHDNWSAPASIAAALRGAGITLVENGAVRRGPLLIGGVGDTVSGHAHLGGTLNALSRLTVAGPGARFYLSHSPDIAHWLPNGGFVLFAAHTHCGQIVLPWYGPIVNISTIFGNRLRCGEIVDHEKKVFVTSGIGTSIMPIRIGAPPDYWIITVGPQN